GTCATGTSLASVLWQTTGKMPEQVELVLNSGEKLNLKIFACEQFGEFACGVIKDSGDDIDVTNHCLVISRVEIFQQIGEIKFFAGDGVGMITRKGLKLPVGEPAINPVPRQMIKKAIRSVIGKQSCSVTISIPDGKKLAEKTFNARLGIQGGLSILGTTGIIRPMSEEAIKESLKLELSMYREEFGSVCAFATGYSGENYLKNFYSQNSAVILCSNYIGYLLDCAENMQFTDILLVGRTGKLTKLSANIMYLHSHTAGGQREVICTHAGLAGANQKQIHDLYHCVTTVHMQELLEKFGLHQTVWASIAESGVKNCELRTHDKIKIAMLLLDENDNILAKTKHTDEILKAWCKCQIN
ncbi:MAG: cobalt-precorrin-5B (C(1))-methyltransferase CbiD, partial [Oscillospiraceae bacterium]|nr:cobalt-precorrin-5B (C(1))-methyltransferase CbiD [Oscillospiraceae bacterium]